LKYVLPAIYFLVAAKACGKFISANFSSCWLRWTLSQY